MSATPRRPSLADVAELSGVSTATVSRVLNEPTLVRAETRELVERAIETLGYTPHFGGRALASNRTDTVGAVIPTMENAIFARGIQALQEELAEAGVMLLVSTSNYDAEQEARQIQTLLSRSVDGLVLIGEARDPTIYALLTRRSVPFVLLWAWRDECPWTCVGFDNLAAARGVAERVFALGHRDIAMIAGVTAGNDRAQARAEGVRAAAAAQGAPLGPDRLIEAPYSFDAGAAVARRLLALTPRPTAILCGNDVLAAGAVRAIKAAGLRIPDDVSVTGFDNIDLTTLIDPPLATVHVPHRRMGRIAARTLLGMIGPQSANVDDADARPDPQSVRIDADFLERGSLAPPPKRP